MISYKRLILSMIPVIWIWPSTNVGYGEIKSTNIPRYDAAVVKAIAFLQQQTNIAERDSPLAAYALLKAGVPQTDPQIVAGLARAKSMAADNNFGSYLGVYEASVAAMLLSDADPEAYKTDLQRIIDRIISFQGSDGSWSAQPGSPDVSLSQYCVLGLWAAQRSGCDIPPLVVDKVANYLASNTNSDGGWRYRPGTTIGPENGNSSHNMTLAAVGSLAIARLFLFGPEETKAPPEEKRFGLLEKTDNGASGRTGVFGDYQPQTPLANLTRAIEKGIQWNNVHFTPIPQSEFPFYFYYTLERAAALTEFREGWFTTYGDALLSLQAPDGSFFGGHTAVPSAVDTSFAILYFMRSTQQILDKQYGLGQQLADRGNPFGDRKPKEPTELDRLIADISKMDFDKLDDSPVEVADDIVRSVLAIDDPEKLVGQEDQLKSLMEHPNDKVRSAAVWALGRTGDFKLIPLLLDGIRDSSVDVNIEAIQALRFIARKPQGFGETLAPFAPLGTDEQIRNAAPDERLRLATVWREKALKDWSNWYFSVRPFEDRGGIDELQLAVPLQKQP